MAGRVVALLVAVLLVVASGAGTSASPEPEPGTPAGTTDRLEAVPGSLTLSEPWVAYPGDYDVASALVRPADSTLGPVPVESCTWDFGDGEVRPGVSERRPGWCRLGKQWDAPGTYTVRLWLRDSQGRDWEQTHTVEVRERPVLRERLRRTRWARVKAGAPEGTVWDLRGTSVADPTEMSPPCRLRPVNPSPRVKCARSGRWVLVGRDAATGWSLQVDLVVRARR